MVRMRAHVPGRPGRSRGAGHRGRGETCACVSPVTPSRPQVQGCRHGQGECYAANPLPHTIYTLPTTTSATHHQLLSPNTIQPLPRTIPQPLLQLLPNHSPNHHFTNAHRASLINRNVVLKTHTNKQITFDVSTIGPRLLYQQITML